MKDRINRIFSFSRALFSYDMQERDRPDTHLIWVIFGTFTAFFAWAYFSEIDRVVSANAKAYPYAKLQTVEHFEGGRVDKILVQKGDKVEKGGLLITLSLFRQEANSQFRQTKSPSSPLNSHVYWLNMKMRPHLK